MVLDLRGRISLDAYFLVLRAEAENVTYFAGHALQLQKQFPDKVRIALHHAFLSRRAHWVCCPICCIMRLSTSRVIFTMSSCAAGQSAALNRALAALPSV